MKLNQGVSQEQYYARNVHHSGVIVHRGVPKNPIGIQHGGVPMNDPPNQYGPKPTPKCEALTKNEKPCRMSPLKGKHLCLSHWRQLKKELDSLEVVE